MSSTRKHKHNFLDLKAKVEIIQQVEKGRKQVDVEKQFNIPTTTLSSILKQKQKILQKWEEVVMNSKAIKNPKFEQLDQALLEWFKQQSAQNIAISGPILANKASDLAIQLGVNDFKSSSGYIEKFKARHGIVFKAITGQSQATDGNLANDWVKNVLPKLTEGYYFR